MLCSLVLSIGTRPILEKLLQLGCFVVILDEFLTSQHCALDGEKLATFDQHAPLRAVCEDCLNDSEVVKALTKRRFTHNAVNAARGVLWPTSLQRTCRAANELAWRAFESTVNAMAARRTSETVPSRAKSKKADNEHRCISSEDNENNSMSLFTLFNCF